MIGFRKASLVIIPATAMLVAQLACLLAAASQAKSPSEALVLVAAETVAKSNRIRLGDIARVFSGDEKVSSRLRAIDLGYSPDVGVVRELTLEKIGLAIKVAGLEDVTVRVEGPRIALVRRAVQVIAPAQVREAVERAVLSDQRAKGAAVRLVRLDLPPVIEVPSGATELRAQIGGGRDLFAPFQAFIEVWAEERLVRRISATAQVEAFAPVAVASRDLAAGVRVRPEDIKIEPRQIKHSIASYVRDADSLRGVAMRRDLAKGEPLLKEALVREIVVKPGDVVRIVGESGQVYIEVKGEARAAGRVGDRIQVRNVQSGALLQCVVEDEGVVRVHF